MATVKKSKKKFIVPICIVLVIAIVVGAVFGVVKSKSGIEVDLYQIGTDDIHEKVSLTGEVVAGTTKEYKVSTVATVKEVYVKVGDKVKKGDILATFDIENLNAEISSMRSSYNESLNAYNTSLEAQKNAQAKADYLEKAITAKEKELARLYSMPETTRTTTKAPTITTQPATVTTDATTRVVTTSKTTTTTTTTTARTTTLPSGSGGATNINDLVDELDKLNQTLSQITDDLDTLTEMTTIIATTVAQALENNIFDSEVIAEMVGDALAQAMRDGIIDAANLLVESDLAIKMVEAAIESIDFVGVANAVTNSKNVSVTAAEIQLAALEGQYAICSLQADPTVVNAQKKAVNAQKKALDILEKQRNDMANGWVAAFDGTITKVDITPGMQTTALATGIVLENLDSMAVKVSLSEYDLHKVKVGMSAKVTTAYGEYTGEVATIAPTATGGSSTSILDSVGSMAGISGLSSLTDSGAGVECVVTIPETDENIIAGFDADVEIETGKYLGVVVVPIESIKLEKTGPSVYVYNEEEGTVTKTPIVTGAVSDSAYEVKEGLKVGDKIVSAPASDYEEDTFKVKVVTK